MSKLNKELKGVENLSDLMSLFIKNPEVREMIRGLIMEIMGMIPVPGTTTTPGTVPVVVDPVVPTSKKGWLGKVFNVLLSIITTVLPFLLKGKGISLNK